MFSIAKRRPGMFASVVTGQYCSVHRLLFVSSLQEWLSFSPAHIERAFGDAMQVVEATCPQCLVAYLLRADQVSRPFPFRLHGVQQPVISPPNVLSTPRPSRWACL